MFSCPPELARVLRDYEKAWSSSRAGCALARLFADDALVLPDSRPMVRGRMNVEQYYTGLGGPLSLRAVAFVRFGEVHAHDPQKRDWTMADCF